MNHRQHWAQGYLILQERLRLKMCWDSLRLFSEQLKETTGHTHLRFHSRKVTAKMENWNLFSLLSTVVDPKMWLKRSWIDFVIHLRHLNSHCLIMQQDMLVNSCKLTSKSAIQEIWSTWQDKRSIRSSMNGFCLELESPFHTLKNWDYSWLRKNTSTKTWICWLWSHQC